MSWYPKKVDISPTVSLSEAELTVLDGITAGTVTGSKAVVVNSTKDIGDFRNLDAQNIDAGAADGTEGTVDVFPTTASKGKITIQCADNTTDHALIITNEALNGASKTATFPAVTGYVAESTAALTLAEVDVLQDVTPGTTAAGKVVTTAAGTNKVAALDITDLKIGGTSVGSTAAQLDAAVAGTPLIYRTNHLTAAVEAGGAVVVPAVAGKKFKVLDLMMRANGGNAANATTIEITEESAGTVFLSHVVADMTSGTWVHQVGGTVVITGMTAGGLTGTANKGLHLSATGGAGLDTCTSVDVIVTGYYTTT
jgi:hypothetical protein